MAKKNKKLTINEVKRQKGKDYEKDYPNLAEYKMVTTDDDIVNGQRS